MPGVFKKAIETMSGGGGDYRNPEMFQRYASCCGQTVSVTARYISIQSYSQLDPELKANQIMVFRLGSRPGENGTYFSLAKTKNGWNDYFLFDDVLFGGCATTSVTVDWRRDRFLPFSIIPSLTETSHVNFALVSGVLEQALRLDGNSISIPATGRGSYTFKVKPNTGLDAVWDHNSGQVEIDSLFVGEREGKKHLFVVEAKSGRYPDSLPKHKLVYPILSIISQVPSDYQIVPVYMRVQEDSESIIFYVAECRVPDRIDRLFVNELTSERVCAIRVVK